MQTLSPTEIALGGALLALIVGLVLTGWRWRNPAKKPQRSVDERKASSSLPPPSHKGERYSHGGRIQAAALDVRPLTAFRRERFIQAWRDVRSRFDSDPAGAVRRADMLMTEVMTARGYSVAEPDGGSAELSTPSGEIRSLYWTGHRVAQRAVRREVGVGELLRAMIHFGALFDDLVNEPEDFWPVLEHRGEGGRNLWKETSRRG